jgi:hypothetical protein
MFDKYKPGIHHNGLEYQWTERGNANSRLHLQTHHPHPYDQIQYQQYLLDRDLAEQVHQNRYLLLLL